MVNKMTENRIRTNMLYVNTIKPHFQAEDVEIILVLKGTITIQKVERTIQVGEGEFTFINRNIVHSIESEGAYIISTKIRVSRFRHIFGKIEYVDFLNNDELLLIDRPLKNSLNENVVQLLINQYCFENNLYEMVGPEAKLFNEECLVNMLFTSYQLITHLKQEEEYPTEKLQMRYYSVVEYVMNHSHQKIVVEDILKELYMNATYFSQFMKKVGGIGFKDFVQYRKLIIIQQYLLEQQVPMTEIANRVGIYDMKSFYNTFKRYFNQRPKTWREEACQREDSYRIEFQKDVLEKFIERHHINCYQETTTSRLYKHLLQVKQRSPLSLEGVEIILNLCKDMEEQFNSRYYVYEYLNDLIHEAYKSKAILHMLHPYQYLEDKEREQLFMNVIGFSVLKLGTGKTKTLKISLVVKDEIEFLQAYRLKQKIEQGVGNLNINIVMDMLI